MRIQALSTFALLVLGAALAHARSPIAARQDDDGYGDSTLPPPDPHAIETDGPRVLLISPTSLQNRSATFETCDPVYLWWFYDPQFMNNPDKFNLTITNVGVNQNPPPPPTSTTTTTIATTSDPTISSESDLGQLPTVGPPKATLPVVTPPPGQPARRAEGDVTLLLVHDQPIFVKEHYFYWPAINVPSGYYVLKGVDTDARSTLPIEESATFFISPGDTSCFGSNSGGGGGQGSPSPTSGSNDNAQSGGPSTVSSGSNKSGIIAGAVVGALLGLLAVAGIFFLTALRRRHKANKARSGQAWGQVNSSDSQGGGRSRAVGLGLPVGATNRLSRNAEAAVKDEYGIDSMDEKYAGGVSRSGSGSTGHSAFSPEPPVFRRHSQASQAFPLGMLSTRESRRSTIQSIPTTVTPNGTPLPSPSPVPAQGAVLSRSTSNVGATGAKKTPRKPVPAYDPAEMSRETLGGGSTPPKRSSTDAGHSSAEAGDIGVQGMSSSQRTNSTVLSAFPFELDGAQGQIHYLIPDPPVSPAR
ncbi:hypothetical protein AURDEDRAFT_110280 [Auricularia subglabra TFB-10046 SS5]|nr:hypothetical protein AURDEDRAFT_110280 [Auricularia subglabra TFB-10046 SS5]